MPDRSHTYLELSNKTQSRLKMLETVLNSISEGFIVVDNSGRIVERNAAAIRMGGFPDLDRTKEFNEKLNEIIEISKLDGTIVPYEDWAVNRTLRGEEFSNVELKLTRKDKPFSIILSYSGVSIKDENGKVELGVISFADITERKQAEETVIKRAQEYRAIFDSAATANVQIDVSDKKFVRVNKRMCEMTGYSTAELLNMHAFDLVHPDERDADMKAYDDFVTGVSQEYSREKRYIRKDGQIIWVNVISSMVRDDKGNPVVTIGSIHDITKNKEFENTLRKRAEEYKSVFELTGSGKAQIEPKTGKFLRVNRKLCSMLGYTAEELRQKTLFDITYPEDLQASKELFEKAQRGEIDDFTFEKRNVRKDGSIIWVLISISLIRENSMPILMGESAFDITERKVLEDRLQETQQRLSVAADAGNVGIWHWDIATDRFVFTEKMLEIFDIPRGTDITLEVVGNSMDRRDRDREINAMREAVRTQSDYESEFRVIYRDASTHWIYSKGKVSKDEKNRSQYMSGASIDMTERKKIELELVQSQERLQLATEGAQVGLWYWNIRDNELDWSDRCKALFNWRADTKATYPKFLDSIYYQDREMVDRIIQNSIVTGRAYSIEFRVVYHDQSVHWMLIKGQTHYDADAKPISMMGMIMDITELKLKQQQLENLTHQFQERTKEYEAVIGFVSHDLRSPIVNVKGFSGELRRDIEALEMTLGKLELPQDIRRNVEKVIKESVPESLGFIDKSAESMELLLTSLVQLARAGLAAIASEKINMDEVVSDILASLEFKVQQAGATVRVDKLPRCTADKSQVSRIFSNLIDNALKYRDKSRPEAIYIRGSVSGSEAIYCVEDNGLGIAPEYQKRIFEIFYRLSQKIQGEGLGLAMVKRMVDRNNGRIWVESEKGKGSRFFVALPK